MTNKLEPMTAAEKAAAIKEALAKVDRYCFNETMKILGK